LNMADGVCLLVDALKDLCHRHDLYYKSTWLRSKAMRCK
jgi:hypothetical protein